MNTDTTGTGTTPVLFTDPIDTNTQVITLSDHAPATRGLAALGLPQHPDVTEEFPFPPSAEVRQVGRRRCVSSPQLDEGFATGVYQGDHLLFVAEFDAA